MTTVTDDFNRANETPLAGNWANGTGEAGFNLTSNAAVPVNPASADGCSIYTGTSFGADHSIVGPLVVSGNNGAEQGMGLCVRHALAARTYYRLIIDHAGSNNATLARFVAAAHTTLVTWTQTFTDGDLFELRVTGPTSNAVLTIYRNGVSAQTFTDTSSTVPASGAPGLSSSSAYTSGSIDTVTMTDSFDVVTTARPFNPIPFMK